ncbi:MAG: recombinase RecA, partial [Desulfatiglandales bacterium]
VGLQARLMSQAMRKLTGTISKSRTCVIFINQTRTNIGVMFGNPETTTGGKALKFYSSVRLNIKKVGTIKDGNQDIGARVKVKVVKNKLAPPFKETEFDIIFGEGISSSGEILDMATNLEIIEKSGAWYSYGNTRLGQGRENVRKFLDENADIRKEIVSLIYEKTGIKRSGDSSEVSTQELE